MVGVVFVTGAVVLVVGVVFCAVKIGSVEMTE